MTFLMSKQLLIQKITLIYQRRHNSKPSGTVGNKIIQALAVILAIFLCFDCQFLSSHALFKQYKALKSWLDKYLFHKTALGMSFLTWIITSARNILLPTVLLLFQILFWKHIIWLVLFALTCILQISILKLLPIKWY